MTRAARGPARIRMSQALSGWLAAQGALSTVARAYLLVGMAAQGVPMAPFIRDLQRVRIEPLPPPLHTAVTELLAVLTESMSSGRPTDDLRVTYGRPTGDLRASYADALPRGDRRGATPQERCSAHEAFPDPFDLGIEV